SRHKSTFLKHRMTPPSARLMTTTKKLQQPAVSTCSFWALDEMATSGSTNPAHRSTHPPTLVNLPISPAKTTPDFLQAASTKFHPWRLLRASVQFCQHAKSC